MFSLISRGVASLACIFALSASAADLAAWSPQVQEHPSTEALQGFLDQYKTLTGQGTREILPIPTGKDQPKLLESIRKGDVGVAVLSGSAVGRIAPMANVMRLPFILRNSRQMFGMLEGEVGQEMSQRLAAQGIILLGWYNGGSRAIYTRNKLGSIAAMQQVKIRVPSRRDLTALVRSLGGAPLQLPYKEVNSAFEAGKIDAAENDLLAYETEGHYKRAPYFYLNNNHIVQFEALVMSKAIWDRLTPAQQAGVKDAGLASARHNRDIWTQRMAKARTRLEKEGVKFLEYGDSSVLLSRVAEIYKPYMKDPATQDLLIRLMTARS